MPPMAGMSALGRRAVHASALLSAQELRELQASNPEALAARRPPPGLAASGHPTPADEM